MQGRVWRMLRSLCRSFVAAGGCLAYPAVVAWDEGPTNVQTRLEPEQSCPSPPYLHPPAVYIRGSALGPAFPNGAWSNAAGLAEQHRELSWLQPSTAIPTQKYSSSIAVASLNISWCPVKAPWSWVGYSIYSWRSPPCFGFYPAFLGRSTCLSECRI